MILQKNLMLSFLKRVGHRNIAYVQGQEPEPKIREYFYYIDHEGMVCIKAFDFDPTFDMT